MIETLKGRLLQKFPTHLIVENNGLGIGVDVPLSTSSGLGDIGTEIQLFTHLHLGINARGGDASLALYGFARELDKNVFLLLTGISGIGPKAALRILSSSSPEELAELVAGGDAMALTRLKGIGKKTAEVLFPQLRNAFADLDMTVTSTDGGSLSARHEALDALLSLGVKESTARSALDKAMKALGQDTDIQQLIPEALKYT